MKPVQGLERHGVKEIDIVPLSSSRMKSRNNFLNPQLYVVYEPYTQVIYK